MREVGICAGFQKMNEMLLVERETVNKYMTVNIAEESTYLSKYGYTVRG